MYSFVLKGFLACFPLMKLSYMKFFMFDTFESLITSLNFDNLCMVLIFLCSNFLCQKYVYSSPFLVIRQIFYLAKILKYKI